MAMINLDANRISTLNTELNSLDSALINNYLPALAEELGHILNNIQGEELHEVLGSVNNGFQNVKLSLGEELPKLESFLEEQLTSYTFTEEELEDQLYAIFDRMTEHIYTVSYIGPAGILNVNNAMTPQEARNVVNARLMSEDRYLKNIIKYSAANGAYRKANCSQKIGPNGNDSSSMMQATGHSNVISSNLTKKTAGPNNVTTSSSTLSQNIERSNLNDSNITFSQAEVDTLRNEITSLKQEIELLKSQLNSN